MVFWSKVVVSTRVVIGTKVVIGNKVVVANKEVVGSRVVEVTNEVRAKVASNCWLVPRWLSLPS